jgi:hypothetical protein
LKEAYATEFAATIERAEKQIILARHGRRLLTLLDDTPVVPGNTRPAYEYPEQARQVLNDAEDDLREWEPELQDVPSAHDQLDHALLPAGSQHIQSGSHADQLEAQSVAGTDAEAGPIADNELQASRVTSNASVTTGPTYAPSTTGTAQAV